MKLSRITPRGVVVLIAMLGIYGFVTVSLILAAYYRYGREAAMLVASGATSISVPVAGLLALFIALWNRTDADLESTESEVEDDVSKEASTRRESIAIDRSIVVIGGGHADMLMEIGTDGMRVGIGGGPFPFGLAVDAARAPAGDRVATNDVTAPRG